MFLRESSSGKGTDGLPTSESMFIKKKKEKILAR